jgi:predicted ATPase
MASLIPGYEYDIFISYRQKDNKYDGWVTEFVDNLKRELEATFKEEVSVYFDINPYDGLLETHEVDESLKEKLKCLIFIPVISRTYCDPKAFAWGNELKAFVEQVSNDKYGLRIKLPGSNVASRVLPVRIHDLDNEDLKLCESILGGVLRGIEFIYKSPGVNRPLRSKEDNPGDNLNKTFYRDQINKVALAIRDIIGSMKEPITASQKTDKDVKADIEERLGRDKAPEVKKHNLTISSTTFIGREKEMKEVGDLYQKSRLVTLTGAGGCGKTRLAREIALTLVEEYKDGVWFTDLAPLTDPNHVAKEITGVLNIKEEPGKAIADTLIENIRDKSFLILLDNCEHLIEACAKIADRLMKSVKGIRIMATSREALNIPGEVVWRIPSLSFPKSGSKMAVDKVQSFEAVRLFTDRAASGNPGFKLNVQNISTVVGICQHVAGIPLAIELAANRIRHMGPETILERLEDQFKILSSSTRTTSERQQTLKATIDWSYNLLSKQEQLLFNRLSIFAVDFGLEAAEEVCSDKELKKEDILPLLSQLVDKSLAIAENREDGFVRYKWLVPLQQYSLQKLAESGEEKYYRQTHLSYYIKMAEQAYEEQFESQLKWLNKLELEHDNIITALNWSYNQANETFILLTSYLAWFWQNNTHFLLGIDYVEKAIMKDNKRSEEYARNLSGLSGMFWLMVDKKSMALNYLTESLNTWVKKKNLFEQAIALRNLTMISHSSGDFESSIKYGRQSLEIARKLGKPGLINASLGSVCTSLTWSKKYAEAKPLLNELLISSEKLEQPVGIILAHHFSGDSAQGTGNFKEAEKEYGKVISLAIKYNMPHQIGIDMQGVAFALAGQLRWAKSIRLDVAARKIAGQYGFTLDGAASFWDEWIETYLKGARKKVGEKLTQQYEEEGRNMDFDSAVKYALDFDKD